MNKHINEPETGNKPGVYEWVNRVGDTVRSVAQNFPQADAVVRYTNGQAKLVQSLDEWKNEQLDKLRAEKEAARKAAEKQVESEKEASNKKGK